MSGEDQADRLLRPLARRAESTLRPPTEDMRARKPCLRAWRILEGWNVRFMASPSVRGFALEKPYIRARYTTCCQSPRGAAAEGNSVRAVTFSPIHVRYGVALRTAGGTGCAVDNPARGSYNPLPALDSAGLLNTACQHLERFSPALANH